MIDKDELKYIQSFMTPRRINKFKEVLDNRTKHFTVLIEDIYQGHNASAVVRSCDVFGIQNLYATERLHDIQISHHVSKGADQWVDLKKFNKADNDNNKDAMEYLRNQGYQIVATSPHYGSTSPEEFDISKPSAIFFGSEKEGLAKEIIDNADAFIKIPMYGFTESLNISVSVAIILQSLVGKLRKSDIDWQLSEEEKLELEFLWSMKTVKDSQRLLEHFRKNKK
jgi:tRNA (guanosine-2'-O-)-methyltransferase